VAADPDPAPNTISGDPVIQEARKRFDRCSEWESTARIRFLDDLKFRHGDSENGYQWPNDIKIQRNESAKPCLTMNIIRQHNLQISNAAKKNKSSVKFIATGNGATQESANALRDIARHVEHQSNAQSAFTIARDFQIDGGIGWFRLVTEYAGPDSFDQEIFIRPVNDPLSIYADPDTQQRDASDMRYAFVFDNVPKDLFEDMYPKYKGVLSQTPLGITSVSDDWLTKDDVRICEYFRKTLDDDQLVSWISDSGERDMLLKSKMPKELYDELKEDKLTKIRDVQREVIEWFLIVGEEIADKTTWPGKYIPLIRVLGEETVIGGILDRKGHTRAMKDAQRMYNYNASAQVEFTALQGKTPWVAPAAAVEEFESMWNTANRTNHSVLIWNHLDDEGNVVPPPFRTAPPTASPAYQAAMETAFNQMMMTSGQYQNEMGMVGNERTGAAIGKRQEQSATAVYHFQDSYEESLINLARQLIDLIPMVYDTRRVLRILADDGTDLEMTIDPTAQQAYSQQMDHNNVVVSRVFNPLLGKYDVAPGVGPAYESKREETVEALGLILTQNPGLTAIVGDLLLSSMGFDKAEEAAARLRRMVPQQALGNGPTQAEQQMQQQIQALTQALTKSLEAHGKDRLKLVGKSEMRDIDVYKAETDRIKALQDQLPLDPQGMQDLITQLVGDAHKTSLDSIVEANKNQLGGDDVGKPALQPDEPPPIPGAQKAPDGEWYLADPTRRGRYLHVAPLAQQRQPPGGGQ